MKRGGLIEAYMWILTTPSTTYKLLESEQPQFLPIKNVDLQCVMKSSLASQPCIALPSRQRGRFQIEYGQQPPITDKHPD